MLQCQVDSSFGVSDGRVDERHRAVLSFDEHAELGAPEDYGLRAPLDKVRDRSLELLPRSGQKDAFGKLCVPVLDWRRGGRGQTLDLNWSDPPSWAAARRCLKTLDPAD
jgi:hypothetical protein